MSYGYIGNNNRTQVKANIVAFLRIVWFIVTILDAFLLVVSASAHSASFSATFFVILAALIAAAYASKKWLRLSDD